MIHPNQHEKNEWSRLATWAYSNGRNQLGHEFSMAAALRTGETVTDSWFDAKQNIYRAWLVFGEAPNEKA